MIEINVAGAGAGKTHGLAQVIGKVVDEKRHKTIYALSFTNAARLKIELELSRQLGSIPDGVVVDTVHGFLLNEIIYPFSSYCIEERLLTSSTSSLSYKQYARSSQLRRLREQGIIHVEEVYSVARKIVDKSHSTHNTKKKKARVDRVLKILSAATHRIFLDEVQDLDDDALRVFEVLGLESVDVYMMGDPKQSIKFPKSFTGFIERYIVSAHGSVKVLPANNITRRVPKQILSLSNRYCYPGQEQESTSAITGSLRFIESIDPMFPHLYDQIIQSGNLIYIDKKTGNWLTKKNKVIGFQSDIEDILRKLCNPRLKDPEVFIESEHIRFNRDVEAKGLKGAVSAFLSRHGIAFSPQIEKSLGSSVNQDVRGNNAVSSIESVKGLEASRCVLILTPNTFKYLCLKTVKEADRFNKEWKKMYVATTRASHEFIVAIDPSLFGDKKVSVAEVKCRLIELGFSELRGSPDENVVISPGEVQWVYEVTEVGQGFQGVANRKDAVGTVTRIYGAIASSREVAIKETKQLMDRIAPALSAM